MERDPKLGLQMMKRVFDSLYYKRQKGNFIQNPYTFVHLGKSQSERETEFINHPIDHQLDYNELVDDLEEEHLKRDVFTTDKGIMKNDFHEESGDHLSAGAHLVSDSKSLTSRGGQPRRAQKMSKLTGQPQTKRQRLY